MLKPLTLSVSLALALGACGVSLAGGHHNDGCATCGIASPQGSVMSPQSVVASPQGCETGCDTCAPKKHCFKMPKFNMPKLSLPKCSYTYEWVLKKKKHITFGHKACGNSGCNECGGEAVYPTSQVAPSSQAPFAAPQAAPQAAGQHAFANPGEMRPALAADEVPPAPTIATQSSLLQLTPSGN